MGNTDTVGILSIVFAFILAPVGLILGIVGIVNNNKNNQSIVLPLVGLILSILFIPVFFIVLGGIAYFGVVDPHTMIPERCVAVSGFECPSFSTTPDGNIEAVIRNGLGRPIEVVGLTIESGGCTDYEIGLSSVPSGEIFVISMTGCDVIRDRTSAAGLILYQYAGLPEHSRINMTAAFSVN
ncbi:MAG: hypothetical protein ACMXYL_04660 [Candidatus Woesearchaeota archaeon]